MINGGMISKKEPSLNDVENPQPIQTAKDETVCPGQSTRVLTGLHFVEEIRYMTQGSNQLILAKVCNRNRVIQQGSMENLMLHGVISLRCMGDKRENFIPTEMVSAWTERDRDGRK